MMQGSLNQAPRVQATWTEATRAELASERAARLRAEARAAEAEEHAHNAEARLAVAEHLVGLLRGELTGAEEHHWWCFWHRGPAMYSWKDAQASLRRAARPATNSPAGDPLGYPQHPR